MRSLFLALWLALCVIPFYSALGSKNRQSPGNAVLINKDVLLMLKAGLTPEVVIAKIKSSDCNFDTDPATLAGLKQAGVPDSVILAMVQVHKTEVNKADGETVFVNCVSNEVKRPIHSTNFFGSSTVAEVGCGESLTSLGKGGGYYIRVRTKQGVEGYIMEDDVSKTLPQIPKAQASSAEPAFPRVVNSAHSAALPSNMLRAVAWRAVPWVTTTYYQQPGTANTDCTGSGTWFGNIWQGNTSCTTQYTPSQSVPINWPHYTIYNLVETANSLMVIGCTRNWAWSKCSYLVPGDTFHFEHKNGRISVKGQRNGKGKEQSLDLDIISTQPKALASFR